MSLTRKFLSAMDIEDAKIDEIINAHVETVDALKEERDIARKEAEANKLSAEKLPVVQKELDDLKQSKGNDLFEDRYNEMKAANEKLQAEFNQYKSDVEAKETKRTKESAYRDLLKKANISDKRIDSIIKVSDLDSIEIDKDGKFKDEENLLNSIKKDWEDFIVTEHQEGAGVATPPGKSTQMPKKESRAAQIAAQYHNNLYGETKKEGE